jgi:predicted Zn-dependent protease with MMP-like domain
MSEVAIVSMPHHVSKTRFGELVERALSEVPPPFAQHLEEIPVEIHDRATPSQRRGAGLKGNELLLGLYVGHPNTERSVLHDGYLPDRIFIFQRDVELVSDSEDDLVEQVRTTVLHEIGHHFGMSEDDLDHLGYG